MHKAFPLYKAAGAALAAPMAGPANDNDPPDRPPAVSQRVPNVRLERLELIGRRAAA